MQVANDRFDASAVAAADRRDYWEAALGATHTPWAVRLSVPQDSFEASIQRWWIDDLALVDCVCRPFTGTRQRRQIADTDGEFFMVLMVRGGRETVSQGDVGLELGPGDIMTWDSAHPARFSVDEDLTKRSLIVPRSAIEEVGGAPWAVPGALLGAASPSARLLGVYLDSLQASLPSLSQSAITAARNATLELLIGALRPEVAGVSAAAGPALRAAIDRYIARHLADDDLSPSAIARVHGVSVRTVNRVFNATGHTVSDVIRVRRLARARRDLAETKRSVASIAGRWGFSDASHLSRTFKAHYGTSPRDFRAQRHAASSGA